MASSTEVMGAAMGLGLVYWGRRALDLPTRLPTWDRWLTRLWQPAAAIIVLGVAVGGPVAVWLGDLFFGGVLGLGAVICWQLRSYRPAFWVGVGLAPYAAYMLVGTLLRLSGSDPLDVAGSSSNLNGFLVMWTGSLFFVARSQHKTLAAEAQRRLEAEQEQRRILGQNHTLEHEVNQRTAALAQQTDALRTTLQELRDTQEQLIQAEKMASLGELTAGIAHEIQNPLNFVNNFAEVSRELADELAEERARPTRDATLEAELLADLKQNLQKINQHGKRAASIVRGMLEHSRASTGERQPTDLNALCDEYLRLAYHGLRAKDKSFNATLQTDFAPVLPLVEAVSQDLGRVLLNLFTNAFYAVCQRQLAAAEPSYAPTVSVRTAFVNREVCVVVQDNGTGIPDAVQAKIFQPFFTTKPSGEGTGLGLALSHDIVVQGHGGALEVASEAGVGTTFTIKLPV
ncbi:MAG TPA: ATP-binding protein [Hymenobacter sp.]|uniref:sensor histidine kinase n=1 Tax=Hymenobacter sp. TaxID=1898978 RepID=UPI002D80DD05|nr:ATP-binding protein [Hymenobacter sp.]HET9505563.1 ATP-binding protein [Hymenobacter sp.]